LTAILIHLQSKKVVKEQEIADRFGISLRTVYRDIHSLEEAGVPLGAEAGIGYFLAEGYHLPPVIFTQKEVLEKIVVRFSKKIENMVQTKKYFFGFTQEKKESNWIEMIFLFYSLEGFSHWLLGFGDKVQVVSPPLLHTMMIQHAKNLSKHYLKKIAYL